MSADIDLGAHIRTIPDFPKPGIMFRDVTTLFAHAEAFAETIRRLADRLQPYEPTQVAAIDARGFIIGGALAVRLGAGFVTVRKKGKLPAETVSQTYDLEYGQAEVEIHVDAIRQGDRVVIVDDLIATGGTGLAAISLVRRLGAEPAAFAAVVDLPDLGGSTAIRGAGAPVETLLDYPGH